MDKALSFLRSRSPLLISILIAMYPLFQFVIPRWPVLAPVGYLWLVALFTALFGSGLWALCQLVQESRRERSWYTVSVVGMWFAVIIALALPPEFSHDEAIMQVGCFLEQIKKSPAKLFGSTCVWAYPSVSFTIQALPALVFGVSMFAIMIGASLLLFPGIALFAYGLRRITRNVPEGDLLAASALGLLSQAIAILRVIAYHDQTTAPTALTLSYLGLLVMCLKEERRAALFLLLPLLVYSTDVYVPVLAVVGAVCVVLAWLAMRSQTPMSWRIPIIVTGLTLAGSFLFNLPQREDFRFGVARHVEEGVLVKVERLGTFLLTQHDGIPYAAPVLWAIVITLCMLGISGRLGLKGAAVTAWIVATIACAFFMEGVSPGLAWSQMGGIHRAAPVFPVIILVGLMLIVPSFTSVRLSVYGRLAFLSAAIIPSVLVFRMLWFPTQPPMGYVMHSILSERLNPQQLSDFKFLVRGDPPVLKELQRHYKVFNPSAKSMEFQERCLPDLALQPDVYVWTVNEGDCEQQALAQGYEVVASHKNSRGSFIFLRMKPKSQ